MSDLTQSCPRRFPHTNLQASGRDLEVLADVVAVEHGVDVGEVDLLVGELTALLQDWTPNKKENLSETAAAIPHGC